MAVLKFLVSAALLGTVARCQDTQPTYYAAYSPGGGITHYTPSIVPRGTPRLVPFKVRGGVTSASRMIPSFYYPQVLPPPLSPSYHRPTRQLPPAYSSMHHQPTYPRLHQQYRPAMTGYYRPTRQSYFGFPFFKETVQQPGTYHTAATSAPVVLKRGRVLSASSPYSLETASAQAGASPVNYQYAPQSIPAVSQYRPAPQHIQHQIAAAPVHHARPQPQYYQPYQQPQQPQFYIQKSPVVVGPARPHKLIKVKKVPVKQDVADTEEDEYPADPNPQYNFSFDIKDDELTNYQNRQEERDGQTIKGSYSVVDPDGYVRTVTYTADPKNGFQAKVTREPTDVKIKFPVPTEAPAQAAVLKSSIGPNGRRHQSYISPQHYQQPQYQAAQYATPQQVYASGAVAASTVQVQTVPVPAPNFLRSTRRYAVQPQQQQQTSESAPQPRIVSRDSVKKPEKTEQSESDVASTSE